MMIQENSGLNIDPVTSSSIAIKHLQTQNTTKMDSTPTCAATVSKLSKTGPRSNNYKTSALTQNVNTLRNSMISTQK
jgi:hypothetical protein